MEPTHPAALPSDVRPVHLDVIARDRQQRADVLDLTLQGYSVAAIAEHLGIAEGLVEHHLAQTPDSADATVTRAARARLVELVLRPGADIPMPDPVVVDDIEAKAEELYGADEPAPQAGKALDVQLKARLGKAKLDQDRWAQLQLRAERQRDSQARLLLVLAKAGPQDTSGGWGDFFKPGGDGSSGHRVPADGSQPSPKPLLPEKA